MRVARITHRDHEEEGALHLTAVIGARAAGAVGATVPKGVRWSAVRCGVGYVGGCRAAVASVCLLAGEEKEYRDIIFCGLSFQQEIPR